MRKNNENMKSVGVNSILNGIQQICHIVIPLVTFPYLTRTLGPEPYGIYSFSNSIISYFLLLGMLGVGVYSIREGARIRNEKDALTNFASEVFSLNLIFVALSYLALFAILYNFSFFSQYRLPASIISFVILSTCIGRDWINSVFEDFLFITLRYIIIQIVGVILIFAFIREPSDYIKYTVIYTITACAGFWINLAYTQKYIPIRVTFNSNLKKHIAPILILFCGQVAVTIYIQSDITMIGLLKDNYNVGIYTVASKIYVIVKSLVNAITTVTIPRIVYYLGQRDKKEYDSFTTKISGVLFALVIPLAIGLFFQSDSILILIGGKEYLQGSVALKILSCSLPFAVFSGFYCNAILIPNREEKSFMWITFAAAAANIIGNLILITPIGIAGAAVTTITSEIMVLLLCIIKTKKVYLRLYKNDFFSFTIANIMVGATCFGTKLFINNVIAEITVSALISIVLYFGLLYILKNNYMRWLLMDLGRMNIRNSGE